jgi:hypothetical protein
MYSYQSQDLSAQITVSGATTIACPGVDVYRMRIMRVNITVPDNIAADAKAAGLNVSRVATAALVEELDRRSKIAALDDYLARLEAELGPIPADEAAEAARWADDLVTVAPPTTSASRRRRSA